MFICISRSMDSNLMEWGSFTMKGNM